MSSVLVKQVSYQEMGFRKGKPNQAGPYFYIPKSCFSFLPALNPTVVNDRKVIDVGGVRLTYTFHNNRTRNEYRIYVTNLVAHFGITPQDIVVLEPVAAAQFNFYIYKPTDPKYVSLQGLIKRFARNGAKTALVPTSRITLP